MDEVILDTDILSEILKSRNAQVNYHAAQYIARHGRFAFSSVTYYEVVRGLLASGAVRQLENFRQLAGSCEIVPISTSILERAARLWADAQVGGLPRDDADLIIAATALENQRVLVTGNTDHFSWIAPLRCED